MIKSEETSPSVRRPLVLLVDDDPMLRLLALEALGDDFEIVEAADGSEAIRLALELEPDVVLLDVMMPNVDGYEVCRQLRAHPSTAVTPILLLTGLDDVDSINLAYEVGATDFVTKPINYTLLTHRLRYVLRAASSFASERENADRLSRAQRLARLAQWELDVSARAFRWSSEAKEIYGLPLTEGDVEGTFLRWIHPEDRERMRRAMSVSEAHSLEYRIVLPTGDERFVHQEAAVMASPSGRVLLSGSAQDVTALRLAEQQVHDLAFFDSLTKLPNRAFLRQFLTHAVADARRHNRLMAVLALDLDGFKRVNDTLGHAAGDELLREVAVRISSSLRGGDALTRVERGTPSGHAPTESLAARLGGDEFVVVLGDLRKPEDAAIVARRIGEKLTSVFFVGGAEIFISSSIGIATFPEHADDVEGLIDRADVALYSAKQSGRNRFQFFSPAMQERARERLEIETGLRSALSRIESTSSGEPWVDARGELRLVYQPKVEVPSHSVVGVEALLRWTPEGRDPISPATFIPVAEDTGLIVQLGTWVLRAACHQARRWVDDGAPLRVSVNVSARQFRELDFVQVVAAAVEESGIDPSFLELEITEGLVMEDTARSQEVLIELKALGVRIALDDFGTGYSSLSYLTRLPVDALKIDRSFVSGLGADRGETITAAIIALSQSLSINVVVEGVENADQLSFVHDHGEAVVQGFFFAKPMPPTSIAEWRRGHEDRFISPLSEKSAA